MMRELIFLDCETTGTEPGDDAGEIVELAIVSEAGEVLFDRKILPQHIETATEEAMGINGYDEEVWAKDAVAFKDVAQEVFSLIDGKLIVGQHITFDTEFLQYEIRRSGIEANVDRISYHSVDLSSIIFYCLVPPLKNSSMYFACEYFGISNEGAHTALVDTQRAREVYLMLMDMKPMLRWPGSEVEVDYEELSGIELAKLDAGIDRPRDSMPPGPIKAMFLRKGDRFSYNGSFKTYEAQSDAVPDSRIEGKVVLLVTDHGLRDRMPTLLDASLVCELLES